MIRLRPLLIVLLVLATLPWRAHLVAAEASASPVVAASQEAASEEGAPVTAAADRGAKAFTLAVPCPGPKLPGSTCSPLPAILPGELSLPVAPESSHPFVAEMRHRDLWQPEGQTDPPRSC